MKAILIDDGVANLENLRTLLEKHCPQVNILATAQNVPAAVDVINNICPIWLK
ncbi:hypothetical protein [Pedobacter sandarakinus]|uniref:hypothetical protein n=1 Tax=Pedobacter sandarakinus TaxID=353156 RepID=UPI00224717B3|nr:hypothetical protein [Pedobacter sandarakinus]MCX2573878.1 hypothetical protein [Pedobacter sandarakinus]